MIIIISNDSDNGTIPVMLRPVIATSGGGDDRMMMIDG